MGKRGKQTKPTALKLVTGNAGRRPINKDEPKPVHGIPDCPSYIPNVAKALWRELAPLLFNMGVLTEADRRALEMVCATYAEYRKADDDVKKNGITYSTTSMSGDVIIKANPAVNMRSDAAKRYLVLIKEFGLTPSSRAGVKVEKKDNSDPLQDFLNRNRR